MNAAALPRLTRELAEARSLLARHARGRRCTLGGTKWEWSMEPLSQGAATAFGETDWQLNARWSGASFELRLPQGAADQWMARRFPELDLPQLPAALRAAAFESALEDLLAALSDAGRGPATVDTVDVTAAAPGVLQHHFGLELTSGHTTICATLSTDALGLMLMAGLAQHWPAQPGPLATGDLPVLLYARAGWATLSSAEIASLEVGDAVFLQDSWMDHEGDIHMRHGDWAMRVRPQESWLVVTQPFTLKEAQMNNVDDDPLGDIPLRL
ncbi:MAG: hypothetical protein Q8N17_15555, partial [Burkholderiaceae bacterium]|nr:hypothetical protein [Burkholderiaceae bacterium]